MIPQSFLAVWKVSHPCSLLSTLLSALYPHPCGIPKGLPLKSLYLGSRRLRSPSTEINPSYLWTYGPIMFPSTERVLQAVWGGTPESVSFLPKSCWLTGKSLRGELAHLWEKASWDRRKVTEVEDQHCSTPAKSTGGEPANPLEKLD